MATSAPTGASPVPRRSRWRHAVHVVPVVALVAVVVIPLRAGARTFAIEDASVTGTAGAPFVALTTWIEAVVATGAVAGFVVLLAYLIVMPARSELVRVFHIVATILAFIVNLGLVLVWFS